LNTGPKEEKRESRVISHPGESNRADGERRGIENVQAKSKQPPKQFKRRKKSNTQHQRRVQEVKKKTSYGKAEAQHKLVFGAGKL